MPTLEAGGPIVQGSALAEQGTPPPDSLLLKLEGFEGPLDLLLDLARAQKVDISKISILALVDQYIATIEGARAVRLELAAEWLVMAAWLTWLKSRLLLPAGGDESEDADLAAERLTEKLQALELIRAAAAWLGCRPILGFDVFRPGSPEDHTAIDRSRLAIDQAAFLAAYLRAIRRGTKTAIYQPRSLTWFTVQDALKRLGSLLGEMPDRSSLQRFLPELPGGPLERRAALSSMLIAGLELARGGALHLFQQEAFGPILVGHGPELSRQRGGEPSMDLGERTSENCGGGHAEDMGGDSSGVIA
jgi:segregation and condensation protein A